MPASSDFAELSSLRAQLQELMTRVVAVGDRYRDSADSAVAGSWTRPNDRCSRPCGRWNERRASSINRHDPTMSRTGSSLLSIRSEGSILSVASKGSILSIGSVGSFLSIGSIGSFASILSIGSFASIGSALSARSRWSLLSHRARRGVLAGDRPRSATSGPLTP